MFSCSLQGPALLLSKAIVNITFWAVAVAFHTAPPRPHSKRNQTPRKKKVEALVAVDPSFAEGTRTDLPKSDILNTLENGGKEDQKQQILMRPQVGDQHSYERQKDLPHWVRPFPYILVLRKAEEALDRPRSIP